MSGRAPCHCGSPIVKALTAARYPTYPVIVGCPEASACTEGATSWSTRPVDPRDRRKRTGDGVGWIDGGIRHLVRDEPPAAAYLDPVASTDVHPIVDPLDPGLPSRDTDDPLDPGSHVI